MLPLLVAHIKEEQVLLGVNSFTMIKGRNKALVPPSGENILQGPS